MRQNGIALAARKQILACVQNARESLDRLEQQAKSDEAFIGAYVRDYARDITAWMYHATSHTSRSDFRKPARYVVGDERDERGFPVVDTSGDEDRAVAWCPREDDAQRLSDSLNTQEA
jgi:hypothetical protein